MQCLCFPCLRDISHVARVGRGPRATDPYMSVIAPPATTRIHASAYAYLVEVDDGLPEGVLHLVEVSHTDFSEVTRMVLVEIGSVMMLATGHTATTGMLPVLADSSMTSGDVTAAVDGRLVYSAFEIDHDRFERCSHNGDVSRYVLFPRLSCSGRHCDVVDGAMLESPSVRTFWGD